LRRYTAEQKRLVAEAERLEQARLASQLGQIMSMNGVSAGFNKGSNGHLPQLETQVREGGLLVTEKPEAFALCAFAFHHFFITFLNKTTL
jgi:hypothetical protein